MSKYYFFINFLYKCLTYFFSPNQIAELKKKRISISWRQLRYQCMEILQYVSKNRLATKMLRVHLFSFFPIKTPRSLAALMPFGFLILWKKLTNVLTPFINSNFSDWVFHNFFKINEWVHKYAIYLVITMPTFTKVLCNVQHLV